MSECNSGTKYSKTLAVMTLHRITTTTLRQNNVVVYRKKDGTNYTNINMWEEKIHKVLLPRVWYTTVSNRTCLQEVQSPWIRPYGCQLIRPYGCRVIRPCVFQLIRSSGCQMIRPYGYQLIRTYGCQTIRPYGCLLIRPYVFQMISSYGCQLMEPVVYFKENDKSTTKNSQSSCSTSEAHTKEYSVFRFAVGTIWTRDTMQEQVSWEGRLTSWCTEKNPEPKGKIMGFPPYSTSICWYGPLRHRELLLTTCSPNNFASELRT